MLKNTKITTLICGAAAVMITVLLYLFTFDNIFTVAMRWVSLLFLVLAETIVTLKMIFIKNSIFGVANITVSILHIIIVLLASIVFVNFLPLLITRYVLLNIFLLCLLLIADVIIIHFTGHVEAVNKELSGNQAVIRAAADKAAAIKVEFSDSAYKKDLEEICDMLQFSDNSVLSGDEITIMNLLEELRELIKNDDDKSSGKITEIKNAVKLRSIKVANLQRGKY